MKKSINLSRLMKLLDIGSAVMNAEVGEIHRLMGKGFHHDSRLLRVLYVRAFAHGRKSGVDFALTNLRKMV